MSDPGRYASYIRGKLRDAVDTIREPGDRTMQERLGSAYVYCLSSLRVEWFPHADAREEFEAIMAALTRYGEAIAGAGSVPTTLATMSDADAAALAERIVEFADRYLA